MSKSLTQLIDLMIAKRRLLAGIFALGLWIISLALPVVLQCHGYHFNGPPTPCVLNAAPDRGIWILLSGWLGLLIGQVSWYANPIILWQIIKLLFNRRPGFISTFIGVCLALTAFSWKNIPTDEGGVGFSMVLQHYPGFYIWIGCTVFLVVVAFVEPVFHWKNKKRKKRGSDRHITEKTIKPDPH